MNGQSQTLPQVSPRMGAAPSGAQPARRSDRRSPRDLERHIASFVAANRGAPAREPPWGPRPLIAGKGRRLHKALRSLGRSPAAWAFTTLFLVVVLLNAKRIGFDSPVVVYLLYNM